MTIHSDWAKILKKLFPHAFSPTLPPHVLQNNVTAASIDGHIQIMGGDNAQSWDHFLHSQFVRPILRLYSQGAKVVVLLFDNRFAVPPYKGMTQYKRSKRYQDIQFSQGDRLPAEFPRPWLDHMMNRHFKDQVIAMVCECIQSLIKPTRDRVLIVDFKGAPKMYTSPTGCPADIQHLTELGESDIKYARYAHMLGSSIVNATDGDYIPIALLYYAVHGITPQNNIFIFRQFANASTLAGQPPPPLPPQPPGAKKLPRGAAAAPRARPRRTMEYMNMQPIYTGILELMQCERHGTPPEVAITGFVAMMLLAGTDYSRALPLVGPKRMADMLPLLLPHITQCLNIEASQIVTVSPLQLAQEVAACMYQHTFQRHVTAHFPTFAKLQYVLHALQHSGLSERTKTLLPSTYQVETTCRNVMWVVHYWKDCLNAQPDFSQAGQFGFSFDASRRQYTWSDLLEQPLQTTMTSTTTAAATTTTAANETAVENEVSMLIPIDPVIKFNALPAQQTAQLADAAAQIRHGIKHAADTAAAQLLF